MIINGKIERYFSTKAGLCVSDILNFKCKQKYE